MYNPVNEDLMFLDMRERADSMRGLRGDRLTRRAAPATSQAARRPGRAVRRWWHKAAVLAG